MAQNALIIPTNQPLPGISLVNSINNANTALATMLSGGTAPTANSLGLGSLAGVWWHNTTAHTINIRDQADTAWILIGTLNETTKQFTPANAGGGGGGGGAGGASLPTGRLHTANGQIIPVDAAGATSVFYNTFLGNTAPIYSGTGFDTYTYTNLQLTLNTSAHLSGKLYDVFLALNAGAVVIGTGPAWASTNSRGSGAGSTEHTRLQGVLVNTQIITLTNGTSSYASIPANRATYVGTIYCTANGQTSMNVSPAAAAGGTNSVLGIYNYYNRMRFATYSSDSTANWAYATATWRPANGSTNHRVTWVDGRAGVSADVAYHAMGIGSTATAGMLAGIAHNNADTPIGVVGQRYTDTFGSLRAELRVSSSLGLNFVQALENIKNASCTFYGGAGDNRLYVSLEM